ncbi:MAG: GSCFA domain-containing protein [Spirochaetales bacterium]|nr:GSCFA domain-containing protein [Spirochaetales bacterium]
MSDNFWKKSYTPVRFPKAPFTISPESKLMFFGSCFAEELATRYKSLDLPNSLSPFGTIYNPLSLAHCFDSLLNKKLSLEPFLQNGKWRHFDFHSSRSCSGDLSLDEAVKHYGDLIDEGHKELLSTDYIIITLGTAWAYRLRENKRVVNNCHRCDISVFERDNFQKWEEKLAQPKLEESLKFLKEINPSVQIILTVSPVRHLRNDARENSYSKAILRCLCEELSGNYDWMEYFPSYEIVMDELRDYRWYGEDLSHLSPRAVDYIMERFYKWAGGLELESFIDRRNKEIKRLNHRPLN